MTGDGDREQEPLSASADCQGDAATRELTKLRVTVAAEREDRHP